MLRFWFGAVTMLVVEAIIQDAVGPQGWVAWERAHWIALPFWYSLLIHGAIWALLAAMMLAVSRVQALAHTTCVDADRDYATDQRLPRTAVRVVGSGGLPTMATVKRLQQLGIVVELSADGGGTILESPLKDGHEDGDQEGRPASKRLWTPSLTTWVSWRAANVLGSAPITGAVESERPA